MKSPSRFLIVDDHHSIRKICTTVGRSLGMECLEAENGSAALSIAASTAPDVILVDLMMPEMDGIELLRELKNRLPASEISMMTGHASVETAVRAMRAGAYDYLSKPFRIDELKLLLQRMMEKVGLVQENRFLRERVKSDAGLSAIVGNSAAMQDVLRVIARLRDTRTPVLITGESGTGKELVARAIHFRTGEPKRPFVAVDCGALVPSLIESELFGHERGAFTGADRAKDGLFVAANGGTLFLDEIGELPLEMQAKLLRVLQEREVRPVGSNKSAKVDVRVIAATNRNLEDGYKNGTFRKDLFFRLNVVSLHLPALRDRRSDIPSLLQCFVEKLAPSRHLSVSADAMSALLKYDWPGNVRELENCVERAIALGTDDVLTPLDLPPAITGTNQMGNVPLDDSGTRASEPAPLPVAPLSDLEDLERVTIQRVYDETCGDKLLTAHLLGISRATLYRKLKRYGIAELRRSQMEDCPA
jgi:DNA-binding NtrC family response regulator